MKIRCCFFLILMMMISGCTYTTRQAEVATKSAEVMPFNLEKTTHIFEKIENGGQQQVVAYDSSDTEQIQLIRQHLMEEAERFAEGDFHDPSMIHGEQMPGLHELKNGSEDIRIDYSEISDGGQILYTTDDPKLILAIHQ